MTTKLNNPVKQSDRYFDLVRAFPLRPIRSETDLDRAIGLIDSLLDKQDLDLDEQDYLDVLSDLVERYEADEHPIAPASDAEMLAHLLEAREITQVELARATEIAESTISEVLSGKRTLSRKHIGKLSAFFGVQPAVFSFPS